MLQEKEEDIGEIYQDPDNQAAILIRSSDVDDGIVVVSYYIIECFLYTLYLLAVQLFARSYNFLRERVHCFVD